jgi:AAA domain, putative AbiEii toxin, Type IV TA system/Overcoming lysogenization defect protein-like, TOPRIM domain
VLVENLRGFRRTGLDLTRDVTILVGPNNSGKTSLLRLTDWALNSADSELLTGGRDLTAEEEALLIPARDTRGGARRLVLQVLIPDGRRHQRFFAEGAVSSLRFRVRGQRIYLNIRPPSRSEPLDAEPDALELLDELRARTRFQLIPASRDAASDRFAETLTEAMAAKLREKAVHQVAGGAPGEYRQVSAALTQLKDVAEQLAQPLWNEIRGNLLPGLAREGRFRLDLEASDLVDWLATRIGFTLVTGEHDPKTVPPVEVGSGLQSLIDLAILRAERIGDDLDEIIAVEEPEAFLHPAAQRTLARSLFEQQEAKLIVSTHSPIIVDEAKFGAVVLVRDHRMYAATLQPDQRREEINTALLTGQGSEAIFARAVLLVEGEGDALFFEALRRRLAPFDHTGRIDQLAIVRVGSKTSFAPWIRLIESYADSTSGERPIEWLVVADGADASGDVRDALRQAGVTVALDVETSVVRVQQAQVGHDQQRKLSTVRDLNAAALAAGLRIHLIPVDIEWCALQKASRDQLDRICTAAGIALGTREEVLRRLGSKYGTGPIADPHKEPWIRGSVGRELPWDEISDDAKDVLRRWVQGAQFGATEITQLFRNVARGRG